MAKISTLIVIGLCCLESYNASEPISTTTEAPTSETITTTTEAPMSDSLPIVEIIIVMLAVILLVFGSFRLSSMVRNYSQVTSPGDIDPVACAVCTFRQGVPRSANVFVCCACHSANFLERNHNGPPQSSSPSPTASGRRMVVTKITDTFYKVENEVGHNEIGTARQETPSPRPVALSDDMNEISDPSLLSPKTDKKGFTGEESCTLCMDNAADTVLLPCSHGGICSSCADALVRRALLNGGALCPHCRSHITSLVRLSEVNDQVARGEEVSLPRAYMLVRPGERHGARLQTTEARPSTETQPSSNTVTN